ncbi:CHRD superfamily protein, partial [Metarhizium majus ARSEF 297]
MKTSVLFTGYISIAAASPLLNINIGKQKTSAGLFQFTSTYSVKVGPRAVVDADNNLTGGLAGASGLFQYGINSYENIICYNLTLDGFRGEYQSPALTATHIHEAPVGRAGPPRIAFPNPQDSQGGRRTSIGCLRGPFLTGVRVEGKDTGEGFHVEQIERNPSAFFTDVHSSLAVPGAVRGQLDSRNKC